jgi:hypothetical protein
MRTCISSLASSAEFDRARAKDIRIIWTEFELIEEEKTELKNLVQEIESLILPFSESKRLDED